MTTRDDYARLLRQLRSEAGQPSLRQMAGDIGVSHTTIEKVLKARHMPRELTHEAVVGYLCILAKADRGPLDEAFRQAQATELADQSGSPRTHDALVSSGPTSLSFKLRFLILAELATAGKTPAWLAEQAHLSEKHLARMLAARAQMSTDMADRLLAVFRREYTVGTAPTFGEQAYEGWRMP